jgi:hypothetical protein
MHVKDSLKMKNKLILVFGVLLVFNLLFAGCENGTNSPSDSTSGGPAMDYITVWPNPQEKQIDVSEGTITVALIATGRYCDVYYDKSASQPTELQLRQIVFNYDNGYENVTSFLNLYEKGGGPSGDGGGDNNPRIQTYIYDLYPAGGRFNTYNGESVYIDINNVDGSTFTHELCHVIFYGNHSTSPETWYHEFLPIMSDVVFHGASIDWTMPNVQLFGVWNNDGGPNSYAYYNTYEKLAEFLVDKYGDSILYDLFHETAVNKQALENVLMAKGRTLSSLEVEFTAWCDNFGDPDDNESRIIVISNVSLTGQVGVWLTSSFSSGNNMPTNTAIQSGTISNNTIAFSLVVPINNTWNSGPAWLGRGDYYVYIVPIASQSYQWNNALVYTGNSSTPSKVTFNKAITRLSFENFREK